MTMIAKAYESTIVNKASKKFEQLSMYSSTWQFMKICLEAKTRSAEGGGGGGGKEERRERQRAEGEFRFESQFNALVLIDAALLFRERN